MQIPRTAVVMLAGLAAGVTARLVFPLPDAHRQGGRLPIAPAGPGEAGFARSSNPRAGPRPEASAIPAAVGGSRFRLLMAWLPAATEEELARMADDLMPDTAGENLGIRLLMARWAEVNPAALVAWSDKQGGDFFRQNAIEAWARVDFDAAWAEACAKRLECRGSALLGLTAVDPDKCLRLLRADPSLLNLEGFTSMDKVLARIAGHDAAGAASLLDGAPAARQSAFAGGVLQAWVKSDPAAAIAWLRTLAPAVRSASAVDAGAWLVEHAPEQVPALLEELPAAGARTQIAATAFENLARRDVFAARRQLESMPDSPARQYCRALLMKELFRAGDEAGAMELAARLGWQIRSDWTPSFSSTKTDSQDFAGHGGTSELEIAMGQLLGRIAVRDPGKAAELLVNGNAPAMHGDFFFAAAEHNPAALAAALLARTGDNRYASNVIYAWARKEPAAAVAWTAANSKSDMECARTVWPALSIWVVTDPAAVSRWANGQGKFTQETAWDQLVLNSWDYAASHPDELFAAGQPQTVSRLLEKLASRPEEERAILQQMPDTMDARIGDSVQRWLQAQPEEASQWVRELPPGARRTNATAAMVNWLNGEGDREAALQWATTLPAEQRGSLVRDTILEWANEDPNAAWEAVMTAGLSSFETIQLVVLLTEQSPSSPQAP